MDRWVDISFDCLPLRSIGRLEIPQDASPRYRARCEHIKQAMEKHGTHNSYFLFNAHCTYHLTNDPRVGQLSFEFTGTALTNEQDIACERCDLSVKLISDTCAWINESIVQWFSETVHQSVTVEFNRYIEAGDLERTRQRIEQLREASDDAGGFVGMYL